MPPRIILACTVGGSVAPVIHAIAHSDREVDFVYFICSTGKNGSDRTLREPSKDGPAILEATGLSDERYAVVGLEDPDNLDATLATLRGVDDDVARRYPDWSARRFVANYTGGTKTMSAGLIMYAHSLSRIPWEIEVQRRYGDRLNLIKIHDGDVSTRQDVGLLHAEEARSLAEALAARFDYDAAAEVLRRRVDRAAASERDRLYAQMQEYRFLAAVERFDLDEALRRLDQERSLGPSYGATLGPLLRRAKGEMALLATPDEPWNRSHGDGTAGVRLLLQSAEHCAAGGRFDDAISRLYRATELLAQARLRRLHGVDTARVAPETLPPALNVPRDSEGFCKLGLRNAYELLAHLGDALGALYRTSDSRLLSWLSARNHSWLAHGFEPVTQSRWDDTGKPWLTWLREAVEVK